MIFVVLASIFMFIILIGFVLEVRFQIRRKAQWGKISKLSNSLPLQVKKVNDSLAILDKAIQRANDLISGKQDSIKYKLLDADSIDTTSKIQEKDVWSALWSYETLAEELRKKYYKSFDELLIDTSTIKKCPEFVRAYWLARKGHVNAVVGVSTPDIELGKFGSAEAREYIYLNIHGNLVSGVAAPDLEWGGFGSVEDYERVCLKVSQTISGEYSWDTIKGQQLQDLVTIES